MSQAVKIIPLGTSSAAPTRERHLTSFALAFGHRWILFDCGEGTQFQLLKTNLKLHQLDAIFITHLHGDHVYGLPGLLGTMGLQGRTAPLQVFGPSGLRTYLSEIHRVTCAEHHYPIEVTEVVGGVIHQTPAYRVICELLDHRVPAYGYCWIEADHPGKFYPEKAKLLKVQPGPDYRKLQSGETVTATDGKQITPVEVLGPSRPGRRIAFCTDTRPCEGSVRLAQNADLLIHEATYLQDLQEKAIAHGHSTSAEAAEVARQAGTKQLLLTHFSARYTDLQPLLNEAQAVFPNSVLAVELAEHPVA